jgi:hypothetical protein
MISSNQGNNVLPKLAVLMSLLVATAIASAQNNKKSAPAAAPHPAAPSSRPAASAPRTGGTAQRPGAAGNTNNRGAGAQTSRPGGANTNGANRGTGAGTTNRGNVGANNNRTTPGGTANRGPAGANANNRGQTGAGANNRPGANNNNARGGANNTNNRGGANNAGNRGGAGGAAAHHQPAGTKTVAMRGGGSATFRSNGQVRTIQAHGMTINHGMRGNTRIVSTHNGRTIVSNGRYGGYSQRAYYSRGGRAYVQRTYFVGGHYYAYGYRSYYWGGHPYFGYAPAFYFGPAYYGWAYNPWAVPVAYGWGWGPSPWFGFYGGYFAPYPVYPAAAFWLTDYLIAANLQAAYEAQQEAADPGDNGQMIPPAIENPSSDEIASLWSTDPLLAANLETAYGAYMLGGGAPQASGNTQLSPDVKKALADEMKLELAAEKDAAAAGGNAPSGDQVPAALDPKIRLFVVSSEEDLTTSDGVECALTAGDVIYRTGDKPDDDNMVDATVKSSKKAECTVGATVSVAVDDLQEMHNQLRIQMDAGLKELADKQGKNGLPAAPDTKTQPGEVPAPAPDTSVGNDLQQQKKDATQVEAEAKQSQ